MKVPVLKELSGYASPVGEADDENAIRAENPAEFAEKLFRLDHVFNDRRANDGIESRAGLIGDVPAALKLDLQSLQMLLRGGSNHFRRRIDAADTEAAARQKRRNAPRTASVIEDISMRRHRKHGSGDKKIPAAVAAGVDQTIGF